MAQKNCATIYSRAWYGDRELELEFPEGWQVEVLAPEKFPRLSEAQIQAAFDQPINTPRIVEMARGKRSAVIVVDDLSRPTPAAELTPLVLKELSQAGIPRSEIRFVVGTGSHRPLTREEIEQKVGPEVAAEYQVTSHDFMNGDLCGLGNLSWGLPIYIDRNVVEAEFKICLGGIYPHGAVGFGGGAKLILPGVSGFATIFYLHTFCPGRGQAVIERRTDEPDHRDAAEDVARLLGLDVVVNAVLNHRREIAGVFVGDFVQAHRQGARFALQVYGTAIPPDLRREADLLVLNCYPLDSDPIQTGKACWPRSYFERARALVINPACDGICFHGLYDQLDYARYLQQREAREPMELPAPQLGTPDQLLIWSEHYPVEDFARKHPKDILFREWDPLTRLLAEELPPDARVAVFPFAVLQVLAEEE